MSKEEDSGEVGPQDTAAASKSSNADIFENRSPKKVIRVVTVVAYLFSVSFVGILLSTYYLFLWEPPNPKLIERARLRADPQVQFLFAAPPSERPKENFLEGNEHDSTYNSLLSRDAYGEVVVDPDEIDRARSRRRRLNAILLKLRHSLVRAQNQNSSRNAILDDPEDTFDKVAGMLNATREANERAENATSGNVLEEKTRSEVPIVERNSENYNYVRKSGAAGADSIRVSSRTRMSNSHGEHRAFEDNDSFSVLEEFPRIDVTGDEKISIAANETSDRMRSDGPRNPDDRSDMYEIATSKEHIDTRTDSFLSVNASVNSSERNDFGGNVYLSSSQAERIARVTVSIDSGFIDERGSHRPPDDALVKRSYVASNSEGVTASRILPSLPAPDTSEAKSSAIKATELAQWTERAFPGHSGVERACSLPTSSCTNLSARMQLPRKFSAQKVMATISRTLGYRDSKPATNEVRLASEENKNKLYKPKQRENLTRVLTVLAYVVFVSMIAILLSLYYTFIWSPSEQPVRMMRLKRPECAKLPLDSLTISPISNETQIEKKTVRSTTINNKPLDEPDLSTIQQQRSFLEILTEAVNVEETSVELTSMSTVQDYYRNNFTSTTNDDDDDVL